MATLLTIKEIQDGLDKEFLPLEPMLAGFRIINGGMSEAVLKECEKKLVISLPAAFRDMVKSLDFGRLTIGPIVFCSTGDYAGEIIKLNTELHWWGSGQRPSGLLMVANSDPYAILLDVNTEHVLAMDAEQDWQLATNIANGFGFYVRGIGTAMLRRNRVNDKARLAKSILDDVGGLDLSYWMSLVK